MLIDIQSINSIQLNTESEVWAVTRGEDGQAGLTEGTGKIICVKVLVKGGKQRANANFERKLNPYCTCCITEASTSVTMETAGSEKNVCHHCHATQIASDSQ